jgi:hypothetical protein
MKEVSMAGRPTPTQDEINKIRMGEEVVLSDDGSGPDPAVVENEEQKKVLTRQAHPERTTAPRTTQAPQQAPAPARPPGG